MTTRAYLADGTEFDIDEETEAKFTHMNTLDNPVVRWAYIGPTPPRPVKPQDLAARRAELQAELDALNADVPPQAAQPPPAADELEQLRARLAALESGRTETAEGA